jgi:hypothetical protein
MAEWPRSGPYLRALAEWGFDSRLATRFAILGSNLFAAPGARGSFLYYCGIVIIFLSVFSRNWESGLSSEPLWRFCGVGRGAGSSLRHPPPRPTRAIQSTKTLPPDFPAVQTSSKLRFHRGVMDPILRLRIPVLTVPRVNGSDFTHLGTSFHRKLLNCSLKTVVPRCVKSESLTLEVSDFAYLGPSFHRFEAAVEHDF